MTGPRTRVLLSLLAAPIAGLLSCCATASGASYGGFSDPQAVTIEGYSASAMEPFIIPGGQYLLFNS